MARQWVLIDGDKLPLPRGYDVTENPKACIRWYIEQLARFAPELADVTCHAQLSSSAGIEHLRKGVGKGRKLSVHLWFFLDRPYEDQELKRWAKRVNALWRGDGPVKKSLIDGRLFHPIQPHFTANPIFEDMADPLPRRSWLIEGERDELSLDIPAEEEIATIAARIGGSIPSGRDYQAYLDMIGDDGVYADKRGFQDTIKMAAIMAVEEQGTDLDIDATIAEIEDRVRRFRGKRPAGEIDRYSSYSFIREKIDWTIGQLVVRQTKAKQRLQGRETLDDARKKLAKVVTEFFEKAVAYRRLRAEYEYLKGRAYLEIERERRNAQEVARLRAIVRRRIKRKLADEYGLDHFPDKAPFMLLRVVQGVGKSWAVLEALARMTTGQFDLYAPNHDLLNEIESDLDALRPILPRNRIRGRRRDDPQGRLLDELEDDAEKMCGYSDKADALLEEGISPQATMCQTCPLFEKCGYQDQFRRIVPEHGVNLIPQAYLSLDANEKISGPARTVIIDESPVGQFFKSIEFEWAMFDDASRVRAIAEDRTEEGICRKAMRRLIEAFPKAYGPVRPDIDAQARFELVWRVVGNIADVLEGYMPMADLDRGKLQAAADLLGEDVDIEARDWAQDDEQPSALRERRDMWLLIEHVLACVKSKRDVRATVELLKDGFKVVTFTPPEVSPHASVIVLDATSEPALLAHVFGRASSEIDVVDIRVKENVRITQVTDTTGSKAALVDKGKDRRTRIWKAAEGFAGGEETFMAVHRDGWPNVDEIAGNLRVGSFGNLRGMNQWKDCTKAVIGGRLLPPPETLERQRAALFVHRGDPDSVNYPPTTIDGYLAEWELPDDELRPDGYFDDDGNPWHPDRITEAMRREICEGEIVQAVGRLRSVNSAEPKEVLLLTDIRVDALPEPARLVPWAKLLRRGIGSPIQTYADELTEGQKYDRAIVVPMRAPDMHKLAPERFKTAKAAKRVLERHKETGDTVEIRASDDEYRATGLALYRSSTSRGGPHARLFFRVKHGINDVAGAIAEKLARRHFFGGFRPLNAKVQDFWTFRYCA